MTYTLSAPMGFRIDFWDNLYLYTHHMAHQTAQKPFRWQSFVECARWYVGGASLCIIHGLMTRDEHGYTYSPSHRVYGVAARVLNSKQRREALVGINNLTHPLFRTRKRQLSMYNWMDCNVSDCDFFCDVDWIGVIHTLYLIVKF